MSPLVSEPTRPSRRELLRGSVAAVAVAMAHFPLSRFGFAAPADGETVIPFLEPQPVDAKRPMIDWQALKDWITPLEQFFAVSHYGMPTLKAEEYQLSINQKQHSRHSNILRRVTVQ